MDAAGPPQGVILVMADTLRKCHVLQHQETRYSEQQRCIL